MFVFKWPPVGVTGAEWTVEDPVSRSASLLTGRVYQSAAKRRRRLAVLNVQGAHGDGGGYVEALKRILKGGLHAVRLESYPLNYGDAPTPDSIRQSWPLGWKTAADADLAWRAGDGPAGLRWYTGGWNGMIATASKEPTGTSGFGRLRVTGLPPSRLIARVGEFVRIYGNVQDTRILLRPVRSNSDGEATVWLDSETAGGGRINFGVPETGVFLPDEMPRAVRPALNTWDIPWSFRQIFEDEISDSFVEIDPWG